jgi:hypothetical protein
VKKHLIFHSGVNFVSTNSTPQISWKKSSRMIDPEDIVTKAIEEDIVDEFTGVEEAVSKLSIGRVSSIPKPKSRVTVTATGSEKSSQVEESDRNTADQTRRMEEDILMKQTERASSNSMDTMVPVSAQHTASNNNASR